jgi:triosephosphate isomerase (TIM)
VRELAEVLNKVEIDTEQVDVIVAPPAIHLELAQQLLQKNIAISAQNVSLTGLGAYTGEIAAEQLIGTALPFPCDVRSLD